MGTLDGVAEDLPDDIDESIFENANACTIDIIPMKATINDDDGEQDVIAVGGATFPFKDFLYNDKGFKFRCKVNEIDDAKFWLAPKDDVDTDELVAEFEKYGFTVTMYDGVDA